MSKYNFSPKKVIRFTLYKFLPVLSIGLYILHPLVHPKSFNSNHIHCDLFMTKLTCFAKNLMSKHYFWMVFWYIIYVTYFAVNKMLWCQGHPPPNSDWLNKKKMDTFSTHFGKYSIFDTIKYGIYQINM